MIEQFTSDFNAFGQVVPAIFRGDFTSASVRDNVAQVAKGTAIQPVSASSPSEIGWKFEAKS